MNSEQARVMNIRAIAPLSVPGARDEAERLIVSGATLEQARGRFRAMLSEQALKQAGARGLGAALGFDSAGMAPGELDPNSEVGRIDNRDLLSALGQ